jgi:alkanesulfonate monooxygenase SsuD/methylene tetrahydromethanopterin reductase-like flavin-dependent oxidoreductase (luciferase family)
VPKPLQQPHPPVWVAARDPGTFDWAIKNGCNIMTWALSRPFAEVELYKERFETALKNNPGVARPAFMTMRHTSIYERPGDWGAPMRAAIRQTGQFENLFKNLGGVTNGFVDTMDVAKFAERNEFDVAAMKENLMFGTPDEVIAKLERYEALGVDYFCYSAAFGQPMAEQKRSLALFIREVMPAFAQPPASKRPVAAK